jgi:hypothetical protein
LQADRGDHLILSAIDTDGAFAFSNFTERKKAREFLLDRFETHLTANERST